MRHLYNKYLIVYDMHLITNLLFIFVECYMYIAISINFIMLPYRYNYIGEDRES